MKAFAIKQFDRFARALARRANHRGNHDVVALAYRQAGLESADFYTEHLLNATEFDTHEKMLAHAVVLANNDGLMLEFGVATGRTIKLIAEHHQGAVYGFDSFEGLPEGWYGSYQRGAFARDALPSVPGNVILIKGWFSDTLPEFLTDHPEPVAFLHVDCDLYSSASFVLTQLKDRIQPGTVIVFDEYFNYPGWRKHEHRAFVEFIDATGLSFRYDSFLRCGQPVCVVIDDEVSNPVNNRA